MLLLFAATGATSCAVALSTKKGVKRNRNEHDVADILKFKSVTASEIFEFQKRETQ
jgi:hypothetical protein